MKDEVNKPHTKFTCVQTKIFQINNILQGLSTFIPMSFDREFTSIGVCTLHGSLIDFRFRVKNARLGAIVDDFTVIDEQSSTFMENGILVERKYLSEQEAQLY